MINKDIKKYDIVRLFNWIILIVCSLLFSKDLKAETYLKWSAQIYYNSPGYIEVHIDCSRLPKENVISNVKCEVFFKDKSNHIIGSEIFPFTDNDLPQLNYPEVYCKYFRHRYSNATYAEGRSLSASGHVIGSFYTSPIVIPILVNAAPKNELVQNYRIIGQLPVTKPTLRSPANGTVFNHYPRLTTLSWDPFPGAVSYTVNVEITDGRNWYVWNQWPGIYNTTYAFQFVGAQVGRWNVWAYFVDGRPSEISEYWIFEYTQ